MKYIRLPRVYNKLKKAQELYSPVIMTAGSGFGKSAAVQYFYRRKSKVVLECRNGEFSEMPDPDRIRAGVVVIENMQWLSEEESIRYLKTLLHTRGIQVIMLTRGELPGYLAGEDMDLDFIRISEEDFRLEAREVEEYFRESGIVTDTEEASKVAIASRGYIRAIHCFAVRMEHGERFSADIEAAVWQDMFRLWDGTIYDEWQPEYVEFALAVCRYESFSVEMAEYLTGSKKINTIIDQCRRATCQLRCKSGGYYGLRPEIMLFFRWKQELLWSCEQITENYRRAAYFYQMKDDLTNALEFYSKAGAIHQIVELLVKNADSPAGVGKIIEIRQYYFDLPEETILSSPALMAGMSRLYDLVLNPEASEAWYERLSEFEKDKTHSRESRREARCRLAYLDIILSHRPAKGLVNVLDNVYALISKGDIVPQELSVTGDLPSVMNGVRDISEWSDADLRINCPEVLKTEAVLGRYGKGLLNVALAENGFEKAGMKPSEVLAGCSAGYEAALQGGSLEICFAATGVQIRQHLTQGQYALAHSKYETFSLRAENEHADRLLPNLEALGVWLSLFGGEREKAANFADKVTDARISFNTPDAYRQKIRARCLAALGRLEEAYDLTVFLNGYFISYGRIQDRIENDVLRSIILYRMKDPLWKELLEDALISASKYGFVHIISIEGRALEPMLAEVNSDIPARCVNKEFFEAVVRETGIMARSYPDYMGFTPNTTISFTNREEKVLSMLLSGQSMEDICAELGISYSGLKKHNRNIYRKLGASNRTEAERRALQLGLVHRGGR